MQNECRWKVLSYTHHSVWCTAAVRLSSTPHVLRQQEQARGRAQGPLTQRHVTTTASCRLRERPVVRASVGVSQIVRSTAVDRRKTTWHLVLVAESPVDPRNLFSFSFSWPHAPTTFSFSSFFFVPFFHLTCVCRAYA